jgi:DNA-binding response OmpR family regulator
MTKPTTAEEVLEELDAHLRRTQSRMTRDVFSRNAPDAPTADRRSMDALVGLDPTTDLVHAYRIVDPLR